MKTPTFQREITFKSLVLNDQNEFEAVPVTKLATFEEISDVNPRHHSLQFKIIAVFQSFGSSETDSVTGNVKMKLDSEGLLELTKLAIETLLVVDAPVPAPGEGVSHKHSVPFTTTDKQEFLRTGSALMSFGLWFLGEKVGPFFESLNLISG